MPKVAARAIEMMRDPNVNLSRISALIETDPVLAALALRAANSAANATANKIQSIQQAAGRIGMKRLRALLIEVSARQVFQSREKRIGEHVKKLWEHSLAVAMLSRDVAVRLGLDDPEVAYQAGLLHDVGKPVIAAMLLEAERQLPNRRANWLDADSWLKVVNDLHRPVARQLAKKWQLPAEVQDAIAQCTDYDPAARRSAGNIVRLCNALAKQTGFYAGEFDVNEVDTLIMVGRSILTVDAPTLASATTELQSRITEVVS